MEKTLRDLYKKLTGEEPTSIEPLKNEGSSRLYYRLSGNNFRCVGTIGTSVKENRAFFALSNQMIQKRISVPAVLIRSKDDLCYLQDDVGDKTLFDYLKKARSEDSYVGEEVDLLCSIMKTLPSIQYRTAENFDFSVCYPSSAFDRRFVLWDLNYFKYCFLKASGLEFDENLLEDDFERFATVLQEEDTSTFMYRDFQSRNVMLKDGRPYFIDFQGGRRGPVYYDVASFVWQTRAHYPEKVIKKMLKAYLESLEKFRDVDKNEFMHRLRYFVLFRFIQTLGAYGFRGLYERKSRFITTIPNTLLLLKELLKDKFPEFPYLCEVLKGLIELPRFATPKDENCLTVEVLSFSYKQGVPNDDTGNGGGFVFDCRGANNPGRYSEYKRLNGTNDEVIKFIEKDGALLRFLEHAEPLVDNIIQNYLSRDFTHLFVAFGCTGGQHRSVYCAERMARHIVNSFSKVKVHVVHRELHREYVLK